MAFLLLLIVAPIVGLCVCSNICCALLCALSSFCNHLCRKKRVGCFTLFVFQIAIVLYFLLKVLWIGLQFVIVVFSDHTSRFFLVICLELCKTRLQSSIVHHCKYPPFTFDIDPRVVVTQILHSTPPHHVTYAPAIFKVLRPTV